jgi:4-hydroxybenzoate polyprenyltransferase
LLAISLSTIYPFAKRFTNFPQFILGAIAGVTVAIAAYAANVDALSGALRGPTICLIGTVILHLVFYDIAYAQQDAQDDMKSGVKGMAVLFYNRIPSLLGVLASGATGLVYWLGRMVNFGPAFFLVGVGGQILSLGGAVVLNQLGLQTELKKVAWLCFVMTACSLIGAFATQI